jgi:hypothetical protein
MSRGKLLHTARAAEATKTSSGSVKRYLYTQRYSRQRGKQQWVGYDLGKQVDQHKEHDHQGKDSNYAS